jgi:hypothetical protein
LCGAAALGRQIRTSFGERLRRECTRYQRVKLPLCVPDQISNPAVQHLPQSFVKLQLLRSIGIHALRLDKKALKHRHAFPDLVE